MYVETVDAARTQASNKSEDQSLPHLDDILGDQKDESAEFPGNGDGELGVHLALVIGAASSNERVVDDTFAKAF